MDKLIEVVEEVRGFYIREEHKFIQVSAIQRLLPKDENNLRIIKDKIQALSEILRILKTPLEWLKEEEIKYEDNEYQKAKIRGRNAALKELHPLFLKLTARVEELEKENKQFAKQILGEGDCVENCQEIAQLKKALADMKGKLIEIDKFIKEDNGFHNFGKLPQFISKMIKGGV